MERTFECYKYNQVEFQDEVQNRVSQNWKGAGRFRAAALLCLLRRGRTRKFLPKIGRLEPASVLPGAAGYFQLGPRGAPSAYFSERRAPFSSFSLSPGSPNFLFEFNKIWHTNITFYSFSSPTFRIFISCRRAELWSKNRCLNSSVHKYLKYSDWHFETKSIEKPVVSSTKSTNLDFLEVNCLLITSQVIQVILSKAAGIASQ